LKSDRVANRVELEAAIEELTVQSTTAEWLAVFEGSGMPYAAINDIQATMNHEHTLARGMIVDVDHDACGPLRLVAPPVKFSGTKPTVRSAPPLLGQHTDEVLKDIMGLTALDIQILRDANVVR